MSWVRSRRKVDLAITSGVAALLLFSATIALAVPVLAPITQWMPDRALLQERASIGVVTQANQWIYVVGGRNSAGKAVNDVWKAPIQPDGSLGMWESQASLPVRLCLHAVVASGGHVYVLGGYDDANYHNEVWRAQIAEGGNLMDWQPDRDYPRAVTLHAAAVANGRIYVSGGDTTQGRTNQVWFAAIGTGGALGEWQEASSLPITSLYRHAMTATNETLYVTGGYDGSTVQAQTYSARINADGTPGEWQLSSLPDPREYHQSVVHDGRLVLLGGRNGAATAGLARVDSAQINANGSLGAWATEQALPEELYRFAAVAVSKNNSDYIYALGGLSGSAYRANVYRSDVPITVTPSVTPRPTPPPPLAVTLGRTDLLPGNELVYIITVSNPSALIASEVVVINTVPVGVTFVIANEGGRKVGWPPQVEWTREALAAGSSWTVKYTVKLPDSSQSAVSHSAASTMVPRPAASAVHRISRAEEPTATPPAELGKAHVSGYVMKNVDNCDAHKSEDEGVGGLTIKLRKTSGFPFDETFQSTDENGYFGFYQIQPGNYEVSIESQIPDMTLVCPETVPVPVNNLAPDEVRTVLFGLRDEGQPPTQTPTPTPTHTLTPKATSQTFVYNRGACVSWKYQGDTRSYENCSTGLFWGNPPHVWLPLVWK